MNQVYLTANEASELLRMSKSKLYKMTMCKSIPHYKCGGKVLFKTQELMDFVEKGINASSVESIDSFDLVSPFSVAA
jgi:excisionase family DNA binding protein